MLRFAPSPTGLLHIGNIRVAILNYLYAKSKNIDFFLRIDDTDAERSEEKYTKSIISDLDWLGIKYSMIIKQSDRKKRYNDTFNLLKKKDLIYPCFETSEELSFKRRLLLKQGKPPIYDRTSLSLKKSEISSLISSGVEPHWRLKLNNETVSWQDEVHGEITFKNLSISDPVVFRSDNLPLFTITSVVDDADLNVSNILRGDDHITNTAAQIQLFKMLDSKVPNFGHFPLIKSKTGESLSKRMKSNSVVDIRNNNITATVLINYLSKVGSSKSVDEINEISELVDTFSMKIFSKSSIIYDHDELERLNSKFIKTLEYEKIKEYRDCEYDENFWEIIKSNIDNLNEADDWYKILSTPLDIDEKIKLTPSLKELIFMYLPGKIDEEAWSEWTKKILEKYDIKPKELYTKLRILLTGKKFGPSMNKLLTLLNKEEIIKRINLNSEE